MRIKDIFGVKSLWTISALVSLGMTFCANADFVAEGWLDTRNGQEISVGELQNLTYNLSWGGGSSASMYYSRNGKSEKSVGVLSESSGNVPWYPEIWGTYVFRLNTGSYEETHTFNVLGRGNGTKDSPIVIEDAEDIYAAAPADIFADIYLTCFGGFTPTAISGYVLVEESGVWKLSAKRVIREGNLDTRTIHSSSPGFDTALAYSANGWGETNAGSVATITCSRNGGTEKVVGTYSNGEGETLWSAPYWGTNVLTFTSGDYTTNHTFIVSGSGSGKKLDPYVIAEKQDLAAFLPRGMDDFVYVTPWSGYNLVAPDGYMLEYQFGVYRLSKYIAPSCVKVTSVKQRYPWNGLVDVAYTIENTRDDHEYELTFYVKTKSGTAAVLPRSEPHRLNKYDGRIVVGNYSTVIDLSSQYPEALELGAVVYAVLNDKGVIGWPNDATGEPVGIMADVMTVDVSGGSSAAEYPVAYYKNVDTGRFNCDKYKTDKIALRKIPAGTYVIGCGESVTENVPRQTATANSPYYIGLFEITERQYALVMGSSPTGRGNTYAVGNISWNAVRGSAGVGDEPGDGFMRRLSDKCKYNGMSVGLWDLPTEGQWEIAARGGSEYEWYTEVEGEVSLWGWTSASASAVQPVGVLRPNAYGLYDMIGNCWEWCRDYCNAEYDSAYVDDPNVNSASMMVRRGGSCLDAAFYGRLSYRGSSWAYSALAHFGFRACVK